MKTWMKFAYIGLSSMTLLSAAGCREANASKRDEQPAVVARVENQPTSEAERDNGPGCAESALDSAALQKK